MRVTVDPNLALRCMHLSLREAALGCWKWELYLAHSLSTPFPVTETKGMQPESNIRRRESTWQAATCLQQMCFGKDIEINCRDLSHPHIILADVPNNFVLLSTFRINSLLTPLSGGALQQLPCWDLSHFSLLITARENFLKTELLCLKCSAGLSEDGKVPEGKDGAPGTPLNVCLIISGLTNLLSPRSGKGFPSFQRATCPLSRTEFAAWGKIWDLLLFLLIFATAQEHLSQDPGSHWASVFTSHKYLLQDTCSPDGYIKS